MPTPVQKKRGALRNDDLSEYGIKRSFVNDANVADGARVSSVCSISTVTSSGAELGEDSLETRIVISNSAILHVAVDPGCVGHFRSTEVS